MSLRRRLLLALVTIGAVLVVTNLALTNRYQSFLLDRIDRQLVDVASRPVFRGDRFADGRGGPRPEEQTLSEYFIAVAQPETGQLVQVGSALADQQQPPPALDPVEIRERAASAGSSGSAKPYTARAVSGDGSWRLVAVQGPRGRVTVVGLGLTEVAETVDRMRAVQTFGTLAVLAALALVFWWVLRLGLHPLEDIAGAADAITLTMANGDLSRRVTPPRGRTEAARLAHAFNAMLERIQRAFAEREASEERVRRFAADASHELRTPLTSIIGYAELYRAGGLSEPGEVRGAMQRVEQEGRRMAALVEDLLTLARLDRGRLPERTRVSLDQMVEGAVLDARAVEPSRPITDAIAAVDVYGDAAQLGQVIGNLLANARVHTPPETAVHVSLERRGAEAVLVVADDGPGIDAETSSRIFDRFFRADTSRGREAGGTGLGLAIVEAVVSAHGGTVSVESSPGDGSRFVVTLPCGSGESPAGSS